MASLLDSKSFVSLLGHVTKQRRPNARQFADYSRIEMSGESVGRQVLSADLRMNPVSANGEKFLHAKERRYDSASSQQRIAPKSTTKY